MAYPNNNKERRSHTILIDSQTSVPEKSTIKKANHEEKRTRNTGSNI